MHDFPAAHRLRMRLLDYPHLLPHALDMLVAFRRDATKNRYRDWEDLLDYCSFSASPVGRFLLDLHGESDDCYVIFGCFVYCAPDFKSSTGLRCGLRVRWIVFIFLKIFLFVYKCEISVLGLDSVCPPLRLVLDSCLDGIGDLLSRARHLPASLSSGRLGLESAVILSMAERLTLLLAKGDPLASRIALGKIDFFASEFYRHGVFFYGALLVYVYIFGFIRLIVMAFIYEFFEYWCMDFFIIFSPPILAFRDVSFLFAGGSIILFSLSDGHYSGAQRRIIILARALLLLTRRNYGGDFRIIVVDDSSSDLTYISCM